MRISIGISYDLVFFVFFFEILINTLINLIIRPNCRDKVPFAEEIPRSLCSHFDWDFVFLFNPLYDVDMRDCFPRLTILLPMICFHVRP